ncbi:MAG TPA: protease modulator HflC [Dongiaceae bacterium]|jgi:membrane protease subunit HflC|nr:protease modulator HflC [Dongiaceae bacterium]
MNRTIGISAILAVAALVVLYSATFFVQQSANAVVVRFGKLIDTVINEPGLHWRVPFIDHVFYIDRRVINIDAPSFTVTTEDQKRIIISAYVRYRILDPETFYRVARAEAGAERRIIAVLNQVLRDEFGSVPMQDVLTEKRATLMTEVTNRLKPQGKNFGIDVVDVRFKRVDLPVENSEAIYKRMKTQRAQEAATFRAQGDREAREKRAEADKQVVILLADARRQAEITRGQGDADAARIYNDAFGQDEKFFDFYRSLKAMQTGLGGNNTTFVGEPKGDFFRFFEQNQGAGGQLPAQPRQ